MILFQHSWRVKFMLECWVMLQIIQVKKILCIIFDWIFLIKYVLSFINNIKKSISSVHMFAVFNMCCDYLCSSTYDIPHAQDNSHLGIPRWLENRCFNCLSSIVTINLRNSLAVLSWHFTSPRKIVHTHVYCILTWITGTCVISTGIQVCMPQTHRTIQYYL